MMEILGTLAVVVVAFAIVALLLAVAPFIATTFEARYMAYCDWAETKVKAWRRE